MARPVGERCPCNRHERIERHCCRKYPFLRRWANIEKETVAASEFTVWETMGPAAATTGYLMGPGLSPKNDLREPAKDVADLPGHWALP